jgi:hypothetical protein
MLLAARAPFNAAGERRAFAPHLPNRQTKSADDPSASKYAAAVPVPIIDHSPRPSGQQFELQPLGLNAGSSGGGQAVARTSA